MKTLFKGIKEITFFVDDVTKASEYYKFIFGEPVFKSDYFVLYNLTFVNIGLHISDKKSSSGQSTVPYFSVEDIDESIKYLLSHNFTIYREKITGVDNQTVCQLISPFHNVVGLIKE